MARRYFNWKLFVVIIIGFLVLAVTAYGLRKWQKSQRADIAYEAGIKAFENKQWDQAAINIGKYIPTAPEDVDMLHKYAEAQINRRPVSQNNIMQAASALRNVLRVKDSDTDAAKKLASLYLKLGSPGEADLIISRFPDYNSNSELGMLRAIALERQRKFHDAAKQLKTTIEANPDHIPAYQELARLSAQREEIVTEGPEHWINAAVEKNPDSARAYIVRANYFLSKNNADAANQDLQKAQSLEIGDTAVKLQLISVLTRAKQRDKAQEYLEQLAAEDPQNLRVWQTWVGLARIDGDPEKVLQVVEKGLQALKESPWDFLSLAAEMYIRCDEVDKAQKCIQKLKEKQMQPVMVARLEAMLADKQNDPFLSVKQWRKVIELGADTPSSRMSLALAYLRAGDSVSATRELNTIINENPDYTQAHMALARQAAKEKNWAQVAVHTGKVKQLQPNNSQANSLFLQSQMQLLGDKQKSNTAIPLSTLEKQIAELEKNSPDSPQAGLMKFRIALGKKDFENAKKILEKLKEKFPDNLKVAIAGADLLGAQEKIEETAQYLEKVIKDFPQSREPVQFLASIMAMQNEQDKSIKLIKEAMDRINDPAESLELGYMLADLYKQWDQPDEQYKLLTALMRKHPNDVTLMSRLLATSKLIEDIDKAQQIVDKIKDLVGEDSWQWRFHQARLWFLSDDFKTNYSKIVSFLKKNLLENPADQQSRLLLAHAHERAGDIQLALAAYREALDRAPDDLRIIIPMVSALYRAKEYELADEILNSTSEENLNNPQLSRLQMQSYLRHGEYSMASDMLRQSLIKNPDNKSDRLSLAMLEMQQQNFAEAARMLEELRKQEPDSEYVINAQIRLNLAQNKNDEAIEICNRLVRDNPKAYSYIIRAQTYNTTGNNEKALQDFNTAVEKYPENADAWLARGNYYASRNQNEKAIADITQGLKINESEYEKLSADEDKANEAENLNQKLLTIKKRLVTQMLSSGNKDYFEKGNKMLAEVAEKNPDDMQLKMIRAELLFRAQTEPSINASEKILLEITKEEPSNADAWNMLGRIAYGRQQYGKAIDFALRGLSARPNDRSLMLLKARSEAKRSPVLAIPTLRTLYDLDPSNSSNAYFLADTYAKTGQPQKAVDLLEKQLEIIDDETEKLRCRVALASAKYKNKQKTQAENEFKTLIEKDEVSELAMATYADTLAAGKRYDDYVEQITSWIEKNPDKYLRAISIIEDFVLSDPTNKKVTDAGEQAILKIIEVQPDKAESFKAMAVLSQITNNNEKAIEYYQKILQIDPDEVISINNLAWALCTEQGKYKQALELANEGLQKAPEYIDLIDTRGVIFSKLGQFDKAIADFEKCLELYPKTNPGVISTHLHLAEAYDGSGRKKKAIRELNTVINLGLQLDNAVRRTKQAEIDRARDLLNILSKGKN